MEGSIEVMDLLVLIISFISCYASIKMLVSRLYLQYLSIYSSFECLHYQLKAYFGLAFFRAIFLLFSLRIL